MKSARQKRFNRDQVEKAALRVRTFQTVFILFLWKGSDPNVLISNNVCMSGIGDSWKICLEIIRD